MKFMTDKTYDKNLAEHLKNSKKCCTGNKLCTAHQAADCYNIPYSTMNDWLNRGKLAYFKFDKIMHIRVRDLKKLISLK